MRGVIDRLMPAAADEERARVIGLRLAITAVIVSIFSLAATASAHTAVVACVDGQYAVTPTHQHLNPSSVIGPANVTVTWDDGFTVTRPLPKGCTPTVAPVVPATPVVPVVPVVPITPVTPITPVVKKPKPKITCATLRRSGAGPRWYARLGHYYRCVVPPTIARPPRRVNPPAVAG